MSAILALDQGTTGSAALVFDERGQVRATADREIEQHYPASGPVEHDAEEIFRTTVAVGREALRAAGVEAAELAAIGITNQRETVVVWDRATGRPIHRAVVWQSRASAAICDQLRADGLEPVVRARTGLVIDAYFSGPKVRWILDQVNGAQARAEAGELLCGTIETWLVWKLTGGRAHVTDVSNASRTLVFDIHRRTWDDELLAALRLPRAMLPSPVRNSGVVGVADAAHFGAPVPIAGLAGDQQAALFGQACFEQGEAKNTYGTGCFLLVNTGKIAPKTEGGLIATIAWDIGDGPRYALEGSAFVTGAAVQWLRDGLGIISDAAETEALARSVASDDGLFLVPAFTGLGAPHWDPRARGRVPRRSWRRRVAECRRARCDALGRDPLRADDGGGGARAPVRGLAARRRSRARLGPALVLRHALREVRHDPVHAQGRERGDLARLVHGPRVHLQ